MGLLDLVRRKPTDVVRSGYPISLDEYLSYFQWNGNQYPLGLQFTMGPDSEEEIMPTFAGYVSQAYHSNGPVFACLLARASLFSEARFQWRQFRQGRPGPLFGNEDLLPLEEPWPNGTTGDLIVRLEQDYSLAGNFYGWRNGSGITRMRPDWVTIVVGSNMLADDPNASLDAEVVGYIFTPGGRSSGHEGIPLDVSEVCHFTGPTPDPTARFRGTSWLTSILREVTADQAATTHKQKFFEQGGEKLAVSIDIPDVEEFQEFVSSYRANTEGTQNAYKTLFFNSGTPNVTKVGADMVQMDFKSVQGAGETRIASAAGVPPIVVGFSEGLESATYSNYGLAMRRFADLTARPFWRMAAGCFQSILTVPPGAQLWYDDRDIPALKEDIEKRAEVQVKQAAAAKQLADGGWEPDSIIDALTSDDFTRLVHSGLPTVQVQQGALPAKTNGKADPQQLQLSERSLADKAKEIILP
jgi:portal protein